MRDRMRREGWKEGWMYREGGDKERMEEKEKEELQEERREDGKVGKIKAEEEKE